MLNLRRHSLFTLVCLVFMAALAVPSIHQFSYWSEPVDNAWPVTDQDAEVHVEEDCETCELIGTLSTLQVNSVAETATTYTRTLPSAEEDKHLAPHLSTRSARAPPARS